MTCIAAVAREGRVWMGGDSAGANANFDLTIAANEKVFLKGEFLCGYTTSFRLGQLLRYAFTPPVLREGQDDLMQYMVVDFVGALRSCLKDGGFAERLSEAERGGNFLVGFRGRLFEIQSNYQVLESRDDHAAVGCGEPYAKGAMFATRDQPPERRVRTALEAAERNSAGVRGPFTILATPAAPAPRKKPRRKA